MRVYGKQKNDTQNIDLLFIDDTIYSINLFEEDPNYGAFKKRAYRIGTPLPH